MCVVDESQRMKKYNGVITKHLLAIASRCKHRLILSATPAPNSLLEYWSQMSFIDNSLLGRNYFAFRNTFFELRRGKSSLDLRFLGSREINMLMQRGYTIEMTQLLRQPFYDRLGRYAHFVDKRDALDLPDEIDVYRKFDMTAEQRKAFKQMAKDLVTEIEGEQVSVMNALSKLMKLRQISSGFIYNEAGEPVIFKKNPKLELLAEVLEEIGNKKIIIFCQYKWEINTLATLIKNSYKLYGDTKDKDGVIKGFKESEVGVLIAHPLSAGVGLSFPECNYMIFYSLSYSFLEYHQARGRIMRATTKKNATYIHLISINSIDEIIISTLKRKEDNHTLFRRVMNEMQI
jgi:SNF2 family DNA or RNA helicase